jgi:hypothetical protein
LQMKQLQAAVQNLKKYLPSQRLTHTDIFFLIPVNARLWLRTKVPVGAFYP